MGGNNNRAGRRNIGFFGKTGEKEKRESGEKFFEVLIMLMAEDGGGGDY